MFRLFFFVVAYLERCHAFVIIVVTSIHALSKQRQKFRGSFIQFRVNIGHFFMSKISATNEHLKIATIYCT